MPWFRPFFTVVQSRGGVRSPTPTERPSLNELELREVERDVERLLMITEALWTLLQEQHGYTDEVLMERIREIDMKDGKEDGRVAADAPRKCPQCLRTMARKHSRCLYCGSETDQDPFGR